MFTAVALSFFINRFPITKCSITNLQWYPAANKNFKKCYKTFVHSCS